MQNKLKKKTHLAPDAQQLPVIFIIWIIHNVLRWWIVSRSQWRKLKENHVGWICCSQWTQWTVWRSVPPGFGSCSLCLFRDLHLLLRRRSEGPMNRRLLDGFKEIFCFNGRFWCTQYNWRIRLVCVVVENKIKSINRGTVLYQKCFYTEKQHTSRWRTTAAQLWLLKSLYLFPTLIQLIK